MKTIFSYLTALIWLICISCAPTVKELTPEQLASEKEVIESKIVDLFDGYVNKDIDVVLSYFSESPKFIAFGTDIAEFYSSKEEWKNQFENDFKLIDSVKPGSLKNLSIRLSKYGDMAVSLFELPLDAKVAGEPFNLLMRVSCTWMNEKDEWQIVQWLASAPSTGQSSEEILKMMEKAKE